MKAICLAISFMLGGSLFASGAIGLDNCGVQCCCQAGPSHLQPSAEKKVQSPMGCCSGAAPRSCDIQSNKSFELPEITLVSSGRDLPDAGGPADILATANNTGQNCGDILGSQYINLKYKSPPLFLQNLSFLI